MGIRRRLGRWALLAVAAPFLASGAEQLSRRLEAARGPNPWSRGLSAGAAQVRRLQPKSRRRR